MIYPTLMAGKVDFVNSTFFEVLIKKCYKGPHSKEEIIKIVGTPPSLSNPHQNVIYKYEPDEDYKLFLKCDYWGIITSNILSKGFQKLHWGKNNIFQSMFIMIRIINNQFYPFYCENDSHEVIRYMIRKQEYWIENEYRTFDTLNQLIESLK